MADELAAAVADGGIGKSSLEPGERTAMAVDDEDDEDDDDCGDKNVRM